MVNDTARIHRAIQAQQVELDLLILKTSTSEARNKLTEGNIYLLSALSALTEAVLEFNKV